VGDGDEEPAGAPITGRISEWVTSLTGSRPEPQNGHATEVEKAAPAAARADRARAPRTPEPAAAARTRRRADSRAAVERERPSWLLRAAAIGLLALLMLALVVIVLSLL
jgi:ferric-dicitrate binding protein FerR (iron transport regulator)